MKFSLNRAASPAWEPDLLRLAPSGRRMRGAPCEFSCRAAVFCPSLVQSLPIGASSLVAPFCREQRFAGQSSLGPLDSKQQSLMQGRQLKVGQGDVLLSRTTGNAIGSFRSALRRREQPRAPLSQSAARKATSNAARVASTFSSALQTRPNHSLKLTRYGMRCLAASGPVGYSPSAAKQRMPPRSA